MTPHPKSSAATVGVGEQVSRTRGNLRLGRRRRAKEGPESWIRGPKVGRRCHRKVELKRVRQEEYAVNGRTALKIGELYRAEFIDERCRPIIEDLDDQDAIGDAEREIQVGVAIAVIQSERTHGGSGYDPVILLRE